MLCEELTLIDYTNSRNFGENTRGNKKQPGITEEDHHLLHTGHPDDKFSIDKVSHNFMKELNIVILDKPLLINNCAWDNTLCNTTMSL